MTPRPISFQIHSPIALIMTRLGVARRLGVIYLLPGAEIELPRRHRHDDLMVHQQALQVRIAVAFAGPVVT